MNAYDRAWILRNKILYQGDRLLKSVGLAVFEVGISVHHDNDAGMLFFESPLEAFFEEGHVCRIARGKLLHRGWIARVLIIVAATNMNYDEQHTRLGEAVVFDIGCELCTITLMLCLQLLEPENISILKEAPPQLGKLFNRISAG